MSLWHRVVRMQMWRQERGQLEERLRQRDVDVELLRAQLEAITRDVCHYAYCTLELPRCYVAFPLPRGLLLARSGRSASS